MYNNNNPYSQPGGYASMMQQQQQWQPAAPPPPPPPPAGPPPPLPPGPAAGPASSPGGAAADAAFRNYGYGSAPQRGGAGGPGGRGGHHQGIGNGGNFRQQHTMGSPLGPHGGNVSPAGGPGHVGPAAYPSNGQPPMHQQQQPMAAQQTYAGGPPHKRARFDHNAAGGLQAGPGPTIVAGLPQNPMQQQQQQQPQQPGMQYAYQAPQLPMQQLPQGGAQPTPGAPMQHPNQGFYPQQPQQHVGYAPGQQLQGPQAYVAQMQQPAFYGQPMQQQQQQPVQQQLAMGNQPYHGQPMVYQGQQQQQQYHQPQQQGYTQPQQQQMGSSAPLPLAVAPMKASSMAGGPRRGPGKPAGSPAPHASLPANPAAITHPLPAPPNKLPAAPGNSLPTGPSQANSRPPTGPAGGSIRLSPKGAATLPPTPTGLPNIPSGPAAASRMAPNGSSSGAPGESSGGPTIRRDTRPLPSQSSTAASARQDRQSESGSSFRPPTQPAALRSSTAGGGRGGGRGSIPSGPAGRGGRGGSTRGAFNDRRGSGRPATDGGRSDGASLGRQGGPSGPGGGVGNKRSFSQTNSANPSPNSSFCIPTGPAKGRRRADSNATITSQTGSQAGTAGGRSTPSVNKKANSGKLAAQTGSRGGSVAGDGTAPSAKGGKGSSDAAALATAAALAQKRTLTDFRIESLEIVELGWSWKAVPLSEILKKLAIKDQKLEAGKAQTPDTKVEDDLEDAADALDDGAGIRENTAESEAETVKAEDGDPDTVGMPALGSETGETDEKEDIVTASQEHVVDIEDGSEAPLTDGVEDLSLPAGSPDIPASTGDAAVPMQRADSRREKRKHSEEQEDRDGEGDHRMDTGEDIEGSSTSGAPVGKKAKSDVAAPPEAIQAGPGGALAGNATTEESTEKEREPHKSPVVTASEDLPAQATAPSHTSTESIVDGEKGEVNAHSASSQLPPSAKEESPVTANDDNDDNDDEEVAARVLRTAGSTASEATPAEEDDKDPVLSAQQASVEAPEAIEDAALRSLGTQSVHDEVLPSKAAAKQAKANNLSASKKYRENSRLRIYFSTPLDESSLNASSNTKKGKQAQVEPVLPVAPKSTRGQKRRAKLDPDALRAQRAMSVESRMSQAVPEPDGRNDDGAQPETPELAKSAEGLTSEGPEADAGVQTEAEAEAEAGRNANGGEDDLDGEPLTSAAPVEDDDGADEAPAVGNTREPMGMVPTSSTSQAAASSPPPTSAQTIDIQGEASAVDKTHLDPPSDDAELATAEISAATTTEAATARGVEGEIKDSMKEEEDLEPTVDNTEGDVPPATQSAQPSEDRVSISYARNSRRIVLDASVVEEMVVHRAEGKIEMKIRLAPVGLAEQKARICAGVYVEVLSQGNNEFSEVDREGLAASWPENTSRDGVRDATEDAEDASVKTEREEEQAEAAEGSIAVSAADELLPPLHRLLVGGAGSAEKLEEDQAPGDSATTATAFVHEIITVVARLDRANPLTEAKWVRAGNPDEWIESIAGPAGALAAASVGLRPQAGKTPKGASYPAMPLNGRDASSESAETSAWKGRIKVADPEAPPTFQHALESWLSTSNTRYGFDEARYRFVSTYFTDINNVLEVLLRLMRGGTGPVASQAHGFGHGHGHGAAGTGGTATAGVPFPEQQTPVTLAAFTLFRLGLDTARGAGLPTADIERRVGEVVRTLPYALVFRSLDSIFTDYKRASGGGGGGGGGSSGSSGKKSHGGKSFQPPTGPSHRGPGGFQNTKRQRK